MQNGQGFTEEEGKERAEKIFETLDKNGDGSLEEEEFIKVDKLFVPVYNILVNQGCLLDKQLLDMLNAGALGTGQTEEGN